MTLIQPSVFLSQWNGSASAAYNCGPASEAMAVERDWWNVKQGNINAIRTWIHDNCDATTGEPGGGSGWSNTKGTQMRQTAAAVLALYGTHTDYRYGFDWDSVFPAAIVGGRGASVSVILGPLYGTNSTIRHRVFVNERRWNSSAGRYEYLVYDPNLSGRKWFASSVLKAAMVAAGTEMNMTRNTDHVDHKVLCSGAHLRVGTSNSTTDGPSVATGDILTLSGGGVSGQAVTTVCPTSQTSRLWYPVSAKNGTQLTVPFYVNRTFIVPAGY